MISTNRLFTAPSNYEPVFEIHINGQDKQQVSLPQDNHFQKMLKHFYACIHQPELREAENKQNLAQAQLLEEIKNKSNES